MIIIVATYYQRQEQLVRTLKSIENTSHKDFEVIIVDDCSPDKIILPETSFPVTVIRTENKDWLDNGIPNNIGYHEALKRGADIIVSQNAECYHVGDVLKYASAVTDDKYISFACFSLSQKDSSLELSEVMANNDHAVKETGGTGWYNHPLHRPVAFDFCAAFTRNTLIDLNGHDERFAYGIGYGDDDMVRRIKLLGLKIEISTDPFVVHQYHYTVRRNGNANDVIKNRDLYLSLSGNIRADHIKTPNFIHGNGHA